MSMPVKYFTEDDKKKAQRLAKKRYVQNHPDRRKQSVKKYDDTHKNEKAEYHKKHYSKNKDKILAYGREYGQRPERKAIRKEQKKEYYKNNK